MPNILHERADRIAREIRADYPQEGRCLDEIAERHGFFTAILPEFLCAFDALIQGFRNGRALFLCGNGGSFADCVHIAGELMKTFKLARPLSESEKRAFAALPHGDALTTHLQRGLPCVVLGLNPSLSSAIQNDSAIPALQYAQELYCLGKPGDMLLAISTSGNAQNVLYAVSTAKALRMPVIGLSGRGGGALAEVADIALRVPETETYRIQEQHVITYHLLCLLLELRFFLA